MRKLHILLLSAAVAHCDTQSFAQDLESDLKVLLAETGAGPDDVQGAPPQNDTQPDAPKEIKDSKVDPNLKKKPEE